MIMTRATIELIATFTRAMGPPVATPEWISVRSGCIERAQYRVFRWTCPCCHAGWDDPIWRPLVIDSDGRVRCEASSCPVESIAREIRALLDAARLFDSLETAA